MSRMRSKKTEVCPECDAQPGEYHNDGCDVARCANCGGQFIFCPCESPENSCPWTGQWPGEAECDEFGWFAIRDPNGGGYIPCSRNTPDAGPDINRLYTDAIWDRKARRWTRRSKRN
jgi:hypothetical protein